MYDKLKKEDIHIIMCSYKRLCNIQTIIKSLNNQSVSSKIHLHILNNNKQETDNLNNIINNTSTKIKKTLKHYNNENNVFERFIYAKELRNKGISYVIFIDDDMEYEPTWVEKMYTMKKPKYFITWYVKLFIYNNKLLDYKNTNNSIILNYNTDSVIKYNDLRNNSNTRYIYGNYGGPGGSIIDTSIFENNDFFKLPHVDIKLMDDIWISYYLIGKLNWTIRRSLLCPTLIWNSTTTQNALFNRIVSKKRTWFLLLINNIRP